MRYKPSKPDQPDRPNGPDRPVLAKWTVMVYMAADNNLDRAALKDIAEIAKVGSTEKVHPVKSPKGGSKAAFHGVNILVQLDREADQKTRRFFITKCGGYWKDCLETKLST